MSRRCTLLVIWCLAFILADRPLAAQEEDWIGVKVLESRPGVTLKSGKRAVGKMSDLGATPLVLETQDDWLRVGSDARSGWVHVRDVVAIDEAVEYFTRAIKAEPKRSWAYNLRGIALQEEGRYDEALKDYSIAVRLNPRDAAALNNRAWILATCPDDQQRDGQLAVTSAQQACKLTNFRQPIYLDTLAAAYAAAGDFKSAYNWQAKAIKQLPHDEDFQREARERLELYASGASFEPTTTEEVRSIETEPAELDTAEAPSGARRRRR
ncbi:MAG TPA: tetratricopeptide repeat protein [Pirellulales bacterium]|nr:tetratricopeptide repeat protein [Pirellulales bacterium]